LLRAADPVLQNRAVEAAGDQKKIKFAAARKSLQQ
jgi:hypothetical protein